MKKGFTLIELLVVIAIIAILAAILFPVFAQAREKARQTTCLSNCKQIGTALNLYVDDYDETMPYLYDSSKTWSSIDQTTYKGYPCSQFNTTDWNWHGADHYWTWMDSIFPYVKNLNMFMCPSAKNNDCSGYAMNMWLNLTNFTSWSDDIQYGIDASKNKGSLACLSNLSSTADLVFTLDCISWKTWNASAFLTLPCNINADNDTNNSKLNRPARHNEGLNFTFCDGHAKYIKKTQGPAKGTGAGINEQYWDTHYNK